MHEKILYKNIKGGLQNIITKNNLVIAVLTLSLGLRFATGAILALAHADESASNNISVSAMDKQDQSIFTEFVSSSGDK
ncbi:hypothetical protein M3661_07635 [Paenibacillus sp. MER 180]|uniref:hypothetical protein n=1 Tax=Paenibacillus sp. MER 180 TaxID=2939570 RepID=UPI00203B753A|nr:hypothetical protein [Paenibacillus sp. MER 180]MCM3289996.1 hypothetical protein [Paenibacillus sp. MER 180]